jgi:hypothetical protein
MTRRTLLSVPFTAGVSALAQRPAGVALFNGSDLSGWSVADGPESAFSVREGAIAVEESGNYPAWLRSAKVYENFDLRFEVFIRGWANGGFFFSAPEHGRPTECGFKLNLFQKADAPPLPESMGAIFPDVAPRLVNVRNKGEWNQVRIRMDWPSLRVWINGEMAQDLDCAAHPALRYKRRSGYLGIESLSYPLRFRGIEVEELPASEKWTNLYSTPADLEKWELLEKARFDALGPVLRANGLGYLATRESFGDFEFQCYVRASRHSNGGIIFRAEPQPSGKHYEIQLHDVEGAVYPTGSLYGYARCRPYPRIEPEAWYPLQVIAKGPLCVVRVNGDTVVAYDRMERLEAGRIMLQAHQAGRWIEYKQIRVKRI